MWGTGTDTVGVRISKADTGRVWVGRTSGWLFSGTGTSVDRRGVNPWETFGGRVLSPDICREYGDGSLFPCK